MPRRFTTADLDHATELYEAGQSFDQVAAALGRSSSEGIRVALQRRGVKARPRAWRAAGHNRLDPPDDLIDRFNNGDSVLAMSTAYQVSRNVVTRWLQEAGIRPRSSSEAARLRMSKMSASERKKLAAAAHDRLRGMERPEEWQRAIAAGRERVQYGGRTSPGTDALCSMLDEHGIDYQREKAIGRYNVDIAIPSARIAVEVLGGNWHSSKGIHARRTPYILNQGWHLLFVWDVKRCKVARGAFDHLVSYMETTSLNPTSCSQYRVIRGDGKLISSGSADDDEFPLVPPSKADLR